MGGPLRLPVSGGSVCQIYDMTVPQTAVKLSRNPYGFLFGAGFRPFGKALALGWFPRLLLRRAP
jgi:hypothetical protein